MKRIALVVVIALLASRSALRSIGDQPIAPPSPPAPFDSRVDPPHGPAPAWFREAPEGRVGNLDGPDAWVVKGRRSTTPERALADADAILRHRLAEWLARDAPTDWAPPRPMVDAMVAERFVEPVVVELPGVDLMDDPVLYVAALRADASPARRGELIDAYRHEVGSFRLRVAAGAIGFVLACLAALAGYIRADEATRGYYTNRLRLVAAAGVGAAGVAAYRWLAG